jgi:hypothetical protein
MDRFLSGLKYVRARRDQFADHAVMRWQFGLRRMLGFEEMREWTELQKLLGDIRLTQQEGVVSWGLTPSKVFTTSSMYSFMTNGGMNNRLAIRIWKYKTPLKIELRRLSS